MNLSLLLSCLLAPTVAYNGLFSRTLAPKAGLYCGPEVALPNLCDDLASDFNTDPSKCKCDLEAFNQCGLIGSVSCDTNTNSLDGDVSLEFAYNAGDAKFVSLIPIEVDGNAVDIEATADISVQVPLPMMDDCTSFGLSKCTAKAVAKKPSSAAKKALGKKLDSCSCSVEGNLPVPAISFNCTKILFDMTTTVA